MSVSVKCVTIVIRVRRKRTYGNPEQGFVYIMANTRNGTLYVGVTNNIVRRVSEHRAGDTEGFTKRYGLKRLVWYEACADIPAAIRREKTIKAWQRAWKLRMIEASNPEWNDLWPASVGEGAGVADWVRDHFGEAPPLL